MATVKGVLSGIDGWSGKVLAKRRGEDRRAAFQAAVTPSSGRLLFRDEEAGKMPAVRPAGSRRAEAYTTQLLLKAS